MRNTLNLWCKVYHYDYWPGHEDQAGKVSKDSGLSVGYFAWSYLRLIICLLWRVYVKNFTIRS